MRIIGQYPIHETDPQSPVVGHYYCVEDARGEAEVHVLDANGTEWREGGKLDVEALVRCEDTEYYVPGLSGAVRSEHAGDDETILAIADAAFSPTERALARLTLALGA